MAVHLRGIDDGELDELHTIGAAAFGQELGSEEREDERDYAEPDRMIAADDDGRFVASAGAFSFAMTVPGGDAVPVAGVTWVAVLPTHRRQGILTSMMRRQLDDVVERGEAIAVLTASEAPIYGRFGYGLATRLAKVKLHTAGGLALRAEPSCGGRLRMATSDEADPHARRVLREVVRQRNGELNRPDHWWPVIHRDREKNRDGASQRFWVLHESASGDIDGYAHYRVKEHWGDDDAIARNEVKLEEVVATDPEVEAALLVFLASIDLTASVTTWRRPVDDPFRLRLADDRRYRVELHNDHLYVRLLDLPVALSARSYDPEHEAVVLGVDDPFRPATSGRYRVVKGECERVGDLHDGDADAFLGVDALGCLYLGDTTARQLAAAGRLKPSSPSALATVDRLFRTPAAPYCTRDF